MKEAKKKSPARIYLTFAVVLIICGIVGGVAGYAAISNELSMQDLSQWTNQMLSAPGPWWFLPALVLLALSTWFYVQGKHLIPQALEDDEVFPGVNLVLCRSMFLANLSTVLMFLAMALSCAASWGIGWSVLLLVVHLVWDMAMQARIISATKQLFPEKRGNIFDFKFQHDWYQSCDEAERQQIAQCSYQAFKIMTTIFPILMAVLALLSMIDLIAPAYSLLVGAIWLVQQFVYNYTALKLDKARL